MYKSINKSTPLAASSCGYILGNYRLMQIISFGLSSPLLVATRSKSALSATRPKTNKLTGDQQVSSQQSTQVNSKVFTNQNAKVLKQTKHIDYSNLYTSFQNKTTLPISTSYSKMDEVKLVTIGLASANRIRQWAEKTLPNGKVVGEVTNANTLHHKTFKPIKGGLFCERIFGPLKDFECACGGGKKTKKLINNLKSISAEHLKQGLNQKTGILQNSKAANILNTEQQTLLAQNQMGSNSSILEHSTNFGHIKNYKRFFCSKCDVEYTWSVIRRYQLGYIKLNAPVTHVWYVKGNPSYISLLLDMKKKHLEYVTYCTETLTLENSLKAAATADEFSIGSDLPQEIFAIWEKVAKPSQQSDLNIVPASVLSIANNKLLKKKNWFYFNNSGAQNKGVYKKYKSTQLAPFITSSGAEFNTYDLLVASNYSCGAASNKSSKEQLESLNNFKSLKQNLIKNYTQFFADGFKKYKNIKNLTTTLQPWLVSDLQSKSNQNTKQQKVQTESNKPNNIRTYNSNSLLFAEQVPEQQLLSYKTVYTLNMFGLLRNKLKTLTICYPNSTLKKDMLSSVFINKNGKLNPPKLNYKNTSIFKLFWKNILEQAYINANLEASVRFTTILKQLPSSILSSNSRFAWDTQIVLTNQTSYTASKYEDFATSAIKNYLSYFIFILKKRTLNLNKLNRIVHQQMSVKCTKIKVLVLKALGFSSTLTGSEVELLLSSIGSANSNNNADLLRKSKKLGLNNFLLELNTETSLKSHWLLPLNGTSDLTTIGKANNYLLFAPKIELNRKSHRIAKELGDLAFDLLRKSTNTNMSFLAKNLIWYDSNANDLSQLLKIDKNKKTRSKYFVSKQNLSRLVKCIYLQKYCSSGWNNKQINFGSPALVNLVPQNNIYAEHLRSKLRVNTKSLTGLNLLGNTLKPNMLRLVLLNRLFSLIKHISFVNNTNVLQVNQNNYDSSVEVDLRYINFSSLKNNFKMHYNFKNIDLALFPKKTKAITTSKGLTVLAKKQTNPNYKMWSKQNFLKPFNFYLSDIILKTHLLFAGDTQIDSSFASISVSHANSKTYLYQKAKPVQENSKMELVAKTYNLAVFNNKNLNFTAYDLLHKSQQKAKKTLSFNPLTKSNSIKTIVNNIYCLSHRELWDQEKDWYFFAFYFYTVPDLDDIAIPVYEYRNYDFSLLNTLFSKEQNTLLTKENSKQASNFSKLDKLLDKQEKMNLHVSYSGAGMVQTLLSEFDYFELKKMDKQNRILLYDLNLYLKKLKKSLAVGFIGSANFNSSKKRKSIGVVASSSYRFAPQIVKLDNTQLKAAKNRGLDNSIFNKKYSLLKKEFKEMCKQRDLLIRRTKLIRKIYRNYLGFSGSLASISEANRNYGEISNSNPLLTTSSGSANNNNIYDLQSKSTLKTDFNKLTSMVLTLLPVLPPDLRPIVKMGSQIAASDLNRLYQRVLYRNDRLKKFLSDTATNGSYEMKYAQRLLQEAVDNLIQNGKSGVVPEKDARGRALKSLSDLLKGKQGRFRQYLLGKRVDYSGRSVIVVGPKLKLHECGIPKEMALELYLPFLIKRILNQNLARTVIGAKALIKDNKPLTWSLLREIMKTCPVLLNRAPTLHRLGFQAFQPKLVNGRAILLHPLACPAFNADFDGDQMAVHVPITVEARTEAWKLMLSRNNLLSPATGEPLVLPSQDMVLGCYYLTTNSNSRTQQNEKGYGMYFDSFNDVLRAYNQGIVATHSIVWVKWNSDYKNNNGGQFHADQPLEIRINQYGSSYIIYSKSHLTLAPNQTINSIYLDSKQNITQNHQNYSKNTFVINKIIRTTPGKILFNTLIQTAWKN